MGRRVRLRRYSRRSANSGRAKRVFGIIFAIVAFLLLSVVLSVAAGLALGRFAEKYDGNDQSGQTLVNDYYSGDKRVKAVNAHEYSWGLGTGYYISIGITDFSVCLRDEDGYITYHSEVAASFSGSTDNMGSRNPADAVAAIKNEGGYVCTYFYSTAFDEPDEYKREILKAYEIALINEAAKSGVDDILIIGLKPTEENIGEMEEFLSNMAKASGKSTLGFLASPEDVKLTDSGVYIVPRLRAVCDFAALDVRGVQTRTELYDIIEELEYYISSGDMRLVFSTANSNFTQNAIDRGAKGVQVVE